MLALLALVAGLVIAGCGDDDDETTTTTTETTGATGSEGETGTKAAFIADAEQICQDASSDLAAEAREQYPEGPPTGEDAATFAEEVLIPNLQGQHDEIAELTPPEGEEDAVADILEKLQSGIDAIADDPEAAFNESDPLADASEAATEFGMTDCGAG
jgi:hypothetical protein